MVSLNLTWMLPLWAVLSSTFTSATTTTTTTTLAGLYRLQALVVQLPNEAPYRYESDMEHVYQASFRRSTEPQQCADSAAVQWELSLHLANRFHASFCLGQTNDDDDKSYHPIEWMGPMVSTKLWPTDPVVRALEKHWNEAIPRVTKARLEEETGKVQFFSSLSDTLVQIDFAVLHNSPQSVEEGEE